MIRAVGEFEDRLDMFIIVSSLAIVYFRIIIIMIACLSADTVACNHNRRGRLFN